MSFPTLRYPPDRKGTYILDHLGPTSLTLCGVQSTTQTITFPTETNSRCIISHSIVTSADDQISFCHNSHNAFFLINGRMKFWNGERCRELCAGDFVFIPPMTSYGYKSLDPCTEFLTLASLENQDTLFLPSDKSSSVAFTAEKDHRQQKSPPFSISLHVESISPSDWLETENRLPNLLQPYFLRAAMGQRWVFGGLVSRPLVRSSQCHGDFSISMMESTSDYPERPFLDRWMSFTTVDHCFYVIDGLIRVKTKGDLEWTDVLKGQAAVIPSRTYFTADIGSKLVRIIALTNGTGLDELVYRAGYKHSGFNMPKIVGKWDGWDEARLKSACAEVGAQIE